MTGQQTRPEVEPAAVAMVWVVRIGVTLFLIPFFAVCCSAARRSGASGG
ncbi:MAG: hypothetical protein ACK4WH_05045 [Phycisphaerales bacterium]